MLAFEIAGSVLLVVAAFVFAIVMLTRILEQDEVVRRESERSGLPEEEVLDKIREWRR